MKIIDKLFEFVITIQFILTMFALIENIYTLDAVVYPIPITEEVIMEIEINMAILLPVIMGIYLAVILASINMVGSGLNEEGTRTVGKIGGYFVLSLVLFVGSSYYFVLLNSLYWKIISMFIGMIYVLKMMFNFAEVE